ncbi:MAG: RelA/SpoT domain-containing protein [Planctomycetaceae bacterium]|nr:RelA/SpoT domain-containing protein [Planctomycetaceae bacterium]
MMSPRYSRSSIDRVGNILVDETISAENLETALSMFNDWRALHLYPMNTFKVTLRKYVGDIDSTGIVAQRLKRTPTIIDKLKNRQKTMRLGTMQDVGGLRAIVRSVQDVRTIEARYKQSRAKHELKKIDDFIAEPKPSGYRGIHLVFVYRHMQPDYDGLFVEIQLRTRLQHHWAAAVETAGFFFQESLKSSQGDEQRLKFFQMVSALFAIEEKELPSVHFHQFTRKALIDKIRQFEETHGILNQLNAIQVASYIKRKKQHLDAAAYWIIRTHLDPPSIEILPYTRSQLESANLTYRLLEKEVGQKGNKPQVVLVSTDSVKKLEKAYPSFFLDIKDFVGAVRKLIQ